MKVFYDTNIILEYLFKMTPVEFANKYFPDK